MAVTSGAKGGSYRESPIISNVDEVVNRIKEAGNGKVWPYFLTWMFILIVATIVPKSIFSPTIGLFLYLKRQKRFCKRSKSFRLIVSTSLHSQTVKE